MDLVLEMLISQINVGAVKGSGEINKLSSLNHLQSLMSASLIILIESRRIIALRTAVDLTIIAQV